MKGTHEVEPMSIIGAFAKANDASILTVGTKVSFDEGLSAHHSNKPNALQVRVLE
jgi:hypothetical protein